MANRPLKRLKYVLGDLFADVLLSLMIPAFRRLQPTHIEAASRAVGRVASLFLKSYRERIISHLSMAFGRERGNEEIRTIMKGVFYHLALTGFETVYGLATETECLAGIEIQGKHHLDEALSLGKGVIAVGAHLGSFTLLGTRLGLEGYKVNIIIDMEHFPRLWNRINRAQRSFSENPFPSKPISLAIKKSLNCLRRNEILYIVADQQQRRSGIPVPFFGRTAYTPPGPAMLSLKTGAPLLPMFVLRGDGMSRRLVIGEAIESERTEDEREDTARLTGKLTTAIEDMVRRHPEQWAWINRRWKQPR